MCTLIAVVRPDAHRALVVAANRDEDLGRPAEGPKPRWFGDVRVFAPLDLEAGGTWMGLSERGVFAALTNRFGTPTSPGRRSRGEIVVEALKAPDATAAYRAATALEPHREKGFHLFLADRHAAFLVVADGVSLRSFALKPGLHIVTERAIEAGSSSRHDLIEARLKDTPLRDLTTADLAHLLADHGKGRHEGVCVHVPEHNFGTRSSAVIELFVEEEAPPTWWVAPGPPCKTPFVALEVGFVPPIPRAES